MFNAYVTITGPDSPSLQFNELLENEKSNFRLVNTAVSYLGGVPAMINPADMSNTIPSEKAWHKRFLTHLSPPRCPGFVFHRKVKSVLSYICVFCFVFCFCFLNFVQTSFLPSLCFPGCDVLPLLPVRSPSGFAGRNQSCSGHTGSLEKI